MHPKGFIFSWLVLLIGTHTYGQSMEDIRLSLQNESPEVRITEYLVQSRYFLNRDPELSLQIAQEVVSEAIALRNDSLKALGLNRVSTAYSMVSDFPSALVNILNAISIWENRGDSVGLGIGYNNLGLIYQYQNHWTEALGHHLRALAVKEAIGDSINLPYSLNNIGEIYVEQGEYSEALTFFQRSLALCIAYNQEDILAHALMLNGNTQAALGHTENAISLLMEALAYNEEQSDTYGKALTMGSLARVYRYQENYPQALLYYQLAESLQATINHRDKLALTQTDIASVYLLLNQTQAAKAKAQEALNLSREIYQIDAEYRALRILYEIAKGNGQTRNALAFLEDSERAYQAMMEQRQTQQLMRMQNSYELSKQEAQITQLQYQQELQDSALVLKEAQARNRFIFALFVALALVIALIAIYILYRQKQAKNRHNYLLAEKNQIINHHKEEIEAQSEQLRTAFEEIQTINESLEKKVQERTQLLQKQNQQLAQFAHLNAHELRGPLASILGLIHLLQLPEHQEDSEIIARLEKSSQQLDSVVSFINRTIETEYNVKD